MRSRHRAANSSDQGNLNMAGSVNKVCERCMGSFSRPPRISSSQWSERKYCSKRCAAMRGWGTPDEAAELYRSGLSTTEIGACLGISSVHAARVLREVGVEKRSASEGKRLSHSRPEVKAKISASSTRRKHSEATKARLRLTSGPDHHGWRAGITRTSGGYLMFTKSKANGVNAGRFLHQVVAEWALGRAIAPGEVVHHRDGNKLNNAPHNLEVMSHSSHARLHAHQSKFWEGKTA